MSSGDGADEPLALATTTSPAQETISTDAATEPDSEVTAIDCGSLLTFDETAEALAIFERPNDERDSFLLSQSEVCGETLASDEAVFVRIEPGNPDDFDTGARLLGTTGEVVEGIGDASLWFGGAEAQGGGDVGLLTVRKETPLGALHFHIVLGRPDLEESAQLEIASGLAITALPRFPGVEVETPEPEVIVFEEETPDQPPTDLFDHLLAREEAGEWTRGEGLVATLALIAGEIDPASVLGQVVLDDPSATEVIRLAEEYLEIGPDQTAKTEIARLLDRLLITEEELEQMTTEDTTRPDAGSLLVSLAPVAQAADKCSDFGMTDPCFVEIGLPDAIAEKYQLSVALGEGSAWTLDHGGLAADALLASIEKYGSLGTVPRITVVLQPQEWTYVGGKGGACQAYVGDDLLVDHDGKQFQQFLAREIAYCLIRENFYDLESVDPNGVLWWSRGLATYLSGYVYRPVNLEHRRLPDELAQVELSTTLPERDVTNWVFFEYLDGFLGANGIMEMIGTFPPGGDQVSALANYQGMAPLYHSFARALTDANVKDLGPGNVPYEPIAWDLPLTGPAEIPFPVPRFGVRRLHVIVPPGFYACFETTMDGEQQVSWRPGGPGEPGEWDELPAVLEGQSMIVITTVGSGVQFRMDVTDVDDDPNCEEEETEPESDQCELNVICRASRYFFRLLGD